MTSLGVLFINRQVAIAVTPHRLSANWSFLQSTSEAFIQSTAQLSPEHPFPGRCERCFLLLNSSDSELASIGRRHCFIGKFDTNITLPGTESRYADGWLLVQASGRVKGRAIWNFYLLPFDSHLGPAFYITGFQCRLRHGRSYAVPNLLRGMPNPPTLFDQVVHSLYLSGLICWSNILR
jgi:hypothetical protein